MSIKYGFFNSENGDRLYNADDLNNFFNGITTDGIFKNYGNSLEVDSYNGNIRINQGKAMILGKYLFNTSSYVFDSITSKAQSRYIAVCAACDLENRECRFELIEGTTATNPNKPTITSSSTLKYLVLAYVLVPANTSTVQNSYIQDNRSNHSECGYVRLTNINAIDRNVYRNSVTTNATLSNINIGISQYDSAIDTLFVYKNGFLLSLNSDYTVSGTGNNAKIVLTSLVPSGQKFDFIVDQISIEV